MAELDICEMPSMTTVAAQSRKEKRKILKKMKRSQFRTETAIKEREEEESRLNDSEVQFLLKLQQEEEAKKAERERAEFEERERLWLEAAAARKSREDQRLQKLLEEQERKEKEHAYGLDADDEYESLDEGPAEIIWKGNEIIVKRRRVKAAKRIAEQISNIEDDDRPTSNSFPPQSAALASFVLGETVTRTEMIDSFVEQVPNFGTEQDKAHCPFHLKTGACRFGSRCSRAHFYPEKSCTLLLKNMYNGPGLSCEQDEGLEVCQLSFLWLLTEIYVNVCSNDDLKLQAWLRTETSHFASYTDEEVECSYEEFYEDVHTEFLKFGEIINFKVCKNSSYHLKGNVYVHYKSLESAFLAFSTMNLRYYAGKQIMCEFVGVTRWKVAICGEYMRSRLKTCSHGSACNFIHCFRNPGGEYEWADWDNPPPRYWIKKMIFLFGTSVESSYDLDLELEDYKRHIELKRHRESRRSRGPKSYRHQSERSHCIEMDLNSSSFEELHDVDEGTTSQKIIEGSPKNHRRTVTNLPEHDRRHENYFRRTRKVYSEEHENSDCNSRNKSHKKQEKMNYDPLEGSDSCRGRSRSPSKWHFFSRHSTQDRIYEKYSSEDLDSDTDSASASRYHYDRRDKLSTRRHRSLRSREHQYVSSKVRKGQRN